MKEVLYEFFGLTLRVLEDGSVFTTDRTITSRNQYGEYTRNIKAKQMAAVSNGKAGYYQIKFSNGGKSKAEYVHRIVWKAFNGEIPEGFEIEHHDDNKANNALDNLRLFTRKENMEKALASMQRNSLGQFTTKGKKYATTSVSSTTKTPP